ncbi:hypothetical protein C2G38_2079631 [Gigaspora rosea]|uniref:Uncharacterized protein n=1 Tax=Gigaspora rosea TaxID=44941 RepID=A0A397VGI7_9GLOM|nr:hypothetical protein C2G38_2079631 [Gigaspora rosea]
MRTYIRTYVRMYVRTYVHTCVAYYIIIMSSNRAEYSFLRYHSSFKILHKSTFRYIRQFLKVSNLHA